MKSLSTARWIFSLLSEQWWRERSADGVVTDLRVMQVRRPAVAGGLLDEDFSGLWDLVVVDEVGLITCERIVSIKVPNSSFAEAHRELLPEPTHMEDEYEDEDQENE